MRIFFYLCVYFSKLQLISLRRWINLWTSWLWEDLWRSESFCAVSLVCKIKGESGGENGEGNTEEQFSFLSLNIFFFKAMSIKEPLQIEIKVSFLFFCLHYFLCEGCILCALFFSLLNSHNLLWCSCHSWVHSNSTDRSDVGLKLGCRLSSAATMTAGGAAWIPECVCLLPFFHTLMLKNRGKSGFEGQVRL